MANVNVNNVFDKKDAWEKVSCPICDKASGLYKQLDVTFWEYPGVYSIYKCKNCGLYLQNPRVKSKYVDMYYENQEYWGCELSNLEMDKNYENIGRKRYHHISKRVNLTNPGKVLDIGCGTGLLLSEFKDNGWEVKGIDISESAIDYAKKMFDIDAQVTDVNSYKQTGVKYDLVTMTHVLEHVYDPVKDLKKVNKLLNKDGNFVLIIPNIKSFGFKVFMEKWFQLQPGRHLYYFSPQTVTKLLDKAGFSVFNIIHNNWEDNYYSHFQSIRYKFSPKFNVNKNNVNYDPRKPLEKNTVYDLKKATASIFAGFLTIASFLTGYSDVITVYAKKKN